jgi:hypothetical protein
LDALAISRWRASLPQTMRHGAHTSLRQVLGAAVRWQWIDRNVATDVPNRGTRARSSRRSSPGRRSTRWRG